MKEVFKKIFRTSTLKYLAAFLLPILILSIYNNALDNDSWFVLAEGRYIANNGVYYEDVLSMHEGLSIVVQNYGFSVIFYWIYSAFGGPGLYFSIIILNLIICFLLYKIYMLLSNKNANLSLLIMVATDLLMVFGFVVTRAQMVSYVIFLILILLLELYVKKKKARYLFLIPVLSFIQINLHASLWGMIFLVMLTYFVDSIKLPALKLHGYKTWPLVVTAIISAAVGFINPYGLRMITFVFLGYSNSDIKDGITEMLSFSPLSGVFNAFVYFGIIAVIVLLIFAKNKNVRIRHLLMFFGFLALGLNTVKGLSQFILIMFLPLSYIYKDVDFRKIFEPVLFRKSMVIWGGLFITCVSAVVVPFVTLSVESINTAISPAMDAMDAVVGDNDKRKYTVYTDYNTGGYPEFRGYRSYIDPRAECFIESINKKADIFKEFYDFYDGRIGVEEMLEKYDFDFVFLETATDPFYALKDDARYETIYEGEDKNVYVFKKVALDV